MYLEMLYHDFAKIVQGLLRPHLETNFQTFPFLLCSSGCQSTAFLQKEKHKFSSGLIVIQTNKFYFPLKVTSCHVLRFNGNNLLSENIFSWCHLWVLFSPNKKWICISVALVTGNPCLEAWLGDLPMPWGKLIVLPANSEDQHCGQEGPLRGQREERSGDNVPASCREGLMGLLPLKNSPKAF